jgi:predicted GNAT family acetyltransferase
VREWQPAVNGDLVTEPQLRGRHVFVAPYDAGMQVRRLEDPGTFVKEAAPVLLADEPRHNLILGLADTLTNHPAQYTSWDLWLVVDDGGVVGAALQTPPWPLAIGRPMHEGALAVLAAELVARGARPPGVSGARPEVEGFADAWRSLTGATFTTQIEHGIYCLDAVADVSPSPGEARRAERADAELIHRWIHDFHDEASPTPHRDPDGIRRSIELRLQTTDPDRAGFWLWEHEGEPRSLSGYGGVTPNGIRIGPVYTPPEYRARGFATTLVAEQSAWLLSRGRRFCFLYTDLSNPTSNAIYQRIGYRKICEGAEIAFEPAG